MLDLQAAYLYAMHNYYAVHYRLPLSHGGTSSALSAKHLSSDLPVAAFGSAWPVASHSDLLTNPHSDLPVAAHSDFSHSARPVASHSGLLTNPHSGLLMAPHSGISTGGSALSAKYFSIDRI